MVKKVEVVEPAVEIAKPLVSDRNMLKIALVLSIVSVTFIVFVVGIFFGMAVQRQSQNNWNYPYYGGYPVYGPVYDGGVMEPGFEQPIPIEGPNGIGDGTTGDLPSYSGDYNENDPGLDKGKLGNDN